MRVEAWTEPGAKPVPLETLVDDVLSTTDGSARIRWRKGEVRGEKLRISKPGYESQQRSPESGELLLLPAHPLRGRCILMCTDLELAPLEILRLYGYRFKIELAFKHALHVVGAFLYHFWMASMRPRRRNGGNQHPHRHSAAYRDALRRKLDAYHRFMQLGLIAQGIMIALATTVPELVWHRFGSWLRTVRPSVHPSERVVAAALRNTLPDFLADETADPVLAKFLCDRLDLTKSAAVRLAA